jgi:hypothetical protein
VRDAFLGLFLYALSALAESPSGLIRYILGTWFFGLFSLGHVIVGVFSIAQLFGLFLALFPLPWSLAAFVFPSGGGPLIRSEKGVVYERWWLGLGSTVNEKAQIRTALNQLTQHGVKCPRKWYVTNKETSQPSNVLGTTLYVSRLSTRYPLTPILAHELGHFNSLDSRLSMARRRLLLLNPLELASLLEGILWFLPATLNLIITLIIGLFLIVFWAVFVGGIGFVLTSGLWSNYLKQRDIAADRYAAKLGQVSALITVLESIIRDEYMPSSPEESGSRGKEAARKHLAGWIDRLKEYK